MDEYENWANEFLRKQLFEAFQIPARFTPGPFHMTYARKAQFRSEEHLKEYFKHCNSVVEGLRAAGPVYLEPERDSSRPGFIGEGEVVGKEMEEPHGVYLFRDRDNIMEYFPPNFHPPYNTEEKRQVIQDVLDLPW